MPIGSTVVYNSGDLILSTVSSSGNTFQENKIAAATSSIILFDSNGRIGSQSLISTRVGSASYVSGSSSIIANLTSSNISASAISGSVFGTSSWASSASFISPNGNAFVQGGNSFGTTATLGTNDNNILIFRTSGSSRGAVDTNGNFIIGGTSNADSPLTIAELKRVCIGNDTGFHNVYIEKPIVVGANYHRLHLGTRWYWNYTSNVWTSSIQPNPDNPDWTAIDSMATYLSFKVGSVTGSTTSLTTSSYDANERFRITTGGAILSTSGSDTELRIINNDVIHDPKITFYSSSTALWAVGTDDSDDNKFKINQGSLLNTNNVITINTSSQVGIGSISPRNRLDVAGNISASSITASLFSGSLSGSVFGTSSWANNSLTASFAPTNTNITASWATNALTASSLVANSNYRINALTASGPIIYDNAVLLDYGSSNMPTTISVVLQNSTGSYNAAFFDYAIFSGSNSRAGIIVSTWNGNSVAYNETSTIDIGNTSLITMSVALSASTIQLGVTGSGVNNWNIKAAGRYI